MRLKKLWIFIALLIGWGNIFGQDTTGIVHQVWPEFDLFYRINPDLRLFVLKSATRLKNSEFTDGGYGIYLDYFAIPWIALPHPFVSKPQDDSIPGRYIWLRAGYTYSNTVPGTEHPSEENSFVTEVNLRYYLPYRILLTERNRMDWRFVNGDYQPRYRPRFRFERDMETAYLTFTGYVYGEYYVNFQDQNANKLRLCAGVEFKATKVLNFEIYEVRQFENKRQKELYATGIVLKMYLNKHIIKRTFSKLKKPHTILLNDDEITPGR